jgi:hypothetical protein
VVGRDETGETETVGRVVAASVRRGHSVRERPSETTETCVVRLITQRRLSPSQSMTADSLAGS